MSNSEHNKNEPEENMSDQELQDLELLELLDDIKLRIGDGPTFLDTPPADVWSSIEAELDQETVEAAAPVQTPLRSTESNVTSLDHHRRKRRPVGILLTAVAAAVVAAVAFPALSGGDTVLAEVALDSLEDSGAIGNAAVIDDGDGTLRLDIEFNEGLVGAESQYELWVIDTDVQEMHSLGIVGSSGEGDTRSYDLPEGVDIGDFPIIDISLEPNDGVETHSGDSKWRGIVDA